MPRQLTERQSARFVKKAIKALGMSQRDFAEAIGYQQPWVSRMLGGAYRLSGPVRRSIESMLALKKARDWLGGFDEEMTCRGGLNVAGRRVMLPGNMTATTFLDHLPTCPACLAHAFIFRRGEALGDDR